MRCLHCYATYSTKSGFNPAYQLCGECYLHISTTNKPYLDVYHGWKMSNKKWDVQKIENWTALKERILFGKFLTDFFR